jgi:hypothetical protein
MGVVTVMNFQATGDGKAAITGDFVLIDREVMWWPARCAARDRGDRDPQSRARGHATPFFMHPANDNPASWRRS